MQIWAVWRGNSTIVVLCYIRLCLELLVLLTFGTD